MQQQKTYTHLCKKLTFETSWNQYLSKIYAYAYIHGESIFTREITATFRCSNQLRVLIPACPPTTHRDETSEGLGTFGQ